jgi:hypothetical protein
VMLKKDEGARMKDENNRRRGSIHFRRAIVTSRSKTESRLGYTMLLKVFILHPSAFIL